MANEEIIGFHKGSLTTLGKERQELVKMINVVDQIIQHHIEELKKLGIDLEAEARKHEEFKNSAPKKTSSRENYEEERYG